MTKIRLLFWTALADGIHGVRYSLVPLLDLAHRKTDAARWDWEHRNG